MALILIENPQNLIPEHSKILYLFFKGHKNDNWDAGIGYSFGNDTIRFSYDILRRQRRNKKEIQGERFEIIDTKNCIGEGGFSRIFPSIGMFYYNEETRSVDFKNNKERVVKYSKTRKEQLEKECLAGMHVKFPVPVSRYLNEKYYSSMLVMKRIAGEPLIDLLKREDINLSRLSLSLRVALTRALLIGLKEQIIDRGFTHRDIKPENIMVRLDEPMQVTYIDWEFACKINSIPIRPQGTLVYFSPETYDNTRHTEKSDLFSLGRTLVSLWGRLDNSYNENTYIKILNNKSEIPLNSLFMNIAGLDPYQKNQLRDLLSHMLIMEEENRININKAIELFNEIPFDFPSKAHKTLILIKDPQNLLPEHRKALYTFFKGHKNDNWEAGEMYSFGNDVICFDYDILRRQCCNKNAIQGERFEIIDTKNRIGKGRYGRVFSSIGVFYYNEETLGVDFKNNKERVVKYSRVIKKQLEKECLVGTHVKNPVSVNRFLGKKIYASMLTMKKISGEPLADILKREDINLYRLSLSQRVQLTRALLIGLKEQITDKGFTHCDITPENIMVNLKESMQVTYIDWEFSSKVNSVSTRPPGTEHYISPEAYNKTRYTDKSDLFSLARVLVILWRGLNNSYYKKEYTLILSTKSKIPLNGLFRDLNGLDGHQKNQLRDLLSQMLLIREEDRININKAIELFNEISFNFPIETHKTLILIEDPQNLSPEHRKTLYAFFKERKNDYWAAGVEYSFGNNAICFSYDILRRQRCNKKGIQGERFEIIDTKNRIGKGQYARVFPSIGVFYCNEDTQSVDFKNNKERVVKYSQTIKEQLEKECVVGTHVKLPVQAYSFFGNKKYVSMLAMKKSTGEPLIDILGRSEIDPSSFSLLQRVKLTRALLIGLKEQIIDRGLVHRDVTPENIMVRLDEPIQVTYIDWEFSCKINSIPMEPQGALAYISPETYDNTRHTEKSDLFSLARTLVVLWGRFDNSYVEKEYYEILCNKREIPLNGLFIGLGESGLDLHQKNQIRDLLSQMLFIREEDRITINKAIELFNEIPFDFADRLSPKIPKIH